MGATSGKPIVSPLPVVVKGSSPSPVFTLPGEELAKSSACIRYAIMLHDVDLPMSRGLAIWLAGRPLERKGGCKKKGTGGLG